MFCEQCGVQIVLHPGSGRWIGAVAWERDGLYEECEIGDGQHHPERETA
jgi:hypothetical protein